MTPGETAAHGGALGRPSDELLARRYALAAEEAAREVRLFEARDLHARMRAAVDAIWTHLSTVGISWVGFYLPEAGPDGEHLVLGPSRNKPACSPIGLHGVCGQGYRNRTPQIVEDVRLLGPNYIACDPRDRSEVVLPLFEEGSDGRCVAVLDVDSHEPGRFGAADVAGLRQVLAAAGLRS